MWSKMYLEIGSWLLVGNIIYRNRLRKHGYDKVGIGHKIVC